MKPSVLFSMGFCALTALPGAALAQDQPWLKDRKYTEGIGYRVGDFELHPGAAAEFGYDSNYLRRSANDQGAGPLGALRLRITPSLSVSTIGSQRREGGGPGPSVEFRAGLSVTYNEFFGISGSAAEKSAINQQRNVGGVFDFTLGILPGRPWSGQLYGGVARQLTASEQGLSGGFNRNLPRAGGELIWTPGAGLFEWRVGYDFSGTFFDSSAFAGLNNLNNSITTRGRWRFLPRTALMYDAKFGFISYTNLAGSATDKTSSHPVRARLGVSGLITPSFAVTAMGGWGASFYSNAAAPGTVVQDFDSFIGQAELKWFLTPNASTADPGATSPTISSIAVGFVRDFADSYIGTYFERDRGYLTFSNLFGGRFLVVVDGGAGPVVYPKIDSLNLVAWTDIRVDASVFGEFRFKDSFGVNLGFRYNQNISQTAVVIQGAAAGGRDELAYKEFETYLGFRWFM